MPRFDVRVAAKSEIYQSRTTTRTRTRTNGIAMEWLAGVGSGRCGLVARVPQHRMPSR